MERSQIRYATGAGGTDIAWQEFGQVNGPRLVFIPGFISHLELNWEAASYSNLFRGLGSVCRVIVFDKRGTGLSSRDLGFGSLAERADDVLAVMNAAGWKRAHLFGMSEGGPMAVLLATSYPERVESLSLYGTYAVGGRTEPGAPVAPTISPEQEALLALLPQVWGTGVALRDSGLVAHADEAPDGLGARFERNACTPHMIAEIMARNYEIDVRPILSAVHVPTLVVHASGDPVVDVTYGRHLAQHIDGATYVELPVVMHTSWRAEDYEKLLDSVLDFVAGSHSRFTSGRVLATVMFTDIVESTRRASQLGDRHWSVLLDQHDLQSQQLITSFGGHFVKHTGDGMMATFDGPARAVQCAQNIRDTLADTGLPIRAGLHTGEVELRSDDLGGIAVHIAARVAALAKEGEVLVSRTVRDLVVGSGLDFEDRGAHELKGVPEDWQIYAAG
jgi:class 3 adenylate cyclase